MATELKYIRHKTLGFVLWPNTDDLWHATVAACVQRNVPGSIVSAGFASVENGEARCWGRSESLKLDSRPREDSIALARQLGLTV